MKSIIATFLMAVFSVFVVSGAGCITEEGDEGDTIYYLNLEDVDGDGHYGLDSLKTPNDDCNDFDPDIYGGATDGCDKKDNDCDAIIDEDCDLRANMVMIPAGCFDMGDAFSEGGSDELPVHTVCITSDYYVDVHEVTNAEYAACVSAGACSAPANSTSMSRSFYYGEPDYDDFPVILVDWYQATEYCTWGGKRLLTEAEWEYAARGGLSGKRYLWGDTITGADANYLSSGDPWEVDTSPVEYYPPNGYGLYDMAGNAWEWTNDWYSSTYYSATPPNDPPGPTSGTFRVIRGGGFNYGVNTITVAGRAHDYPVNEEHWIGFRCAGE